MAYGDWGCDGGYGDVPNGDWYGAGDGGFGEIRWRFAGGMPLPMLGDMAVGDCWYDCGEKARCCP
jgi:hypothetical protein